MILRKRNMSFMAVPMAVLCLGSYACSTPKIDAVTTATTVASSNIDEDNGGPSGRALVILASAPGGNTEKIARAMASALRARVLSPTEAASDLSADELIGFGSGIMDQKHHQALLSFVDALPPQEGKKAFIFSTSGVSRQFALDHGIDDPHTLLRGKLLEKGFTITGEFNCAGFNANSFLKLFGGMNKGRPNQADLARAEDFARGLLVGEEAP